MLYKFKSQATADIIMLGSDAHEVMKIIGKKNTSQGIITKEQIPHAIKSLRQALIDDHALHSMVDNKNYQNNNEEKNFNIEIIFSQRILPLLHIMEIARKYNVAVIWMEVNK